MSVMATNSVTSSGLVSGRVSALVNHLDDLSCERLSGYVNNDKDKLDELNFSVSDNANFQDLGRVNAAFEDFEDLETGEKNDELKNSSADSAEEEHVYANFSEITKHDQNEDIDRRPIPPRPSVEMKPIRTMPTGWQEFKTTGGRTFYFHPEKNICQWKPPRNPKSFHMLSQYLQQQYEHKPNSNSINNSVRAHNYQEQNSNSLVESRQSEPPSTTFPSTEAFGEVPPQHEYDQACCSLEPHDDIVPDGMISFHSAMVKAFEKENEQKKQMSQSVNGDFAHRGGHARSYFNNQCESSSPIYVHSSTSQHCPNTTSGINNAITLNTTTDIFKNSDNVELSKELSLQNHNYSATPIRQGTLEKCRLADCGVKFKKKEWTSAYAYLYSNHLLFYKDQKSAEKTGKHYPAPTDVCDLRGAVLLYVDAEKQKDRRRKHAISLLLVNKTEYWFSCLNNESDINGWFHALRQAISALPPLMQTHPLPIIMDYGGSLQRGSTKSKTFLLQNTKAGSKTIKSKLRKSSSKESVETDNSSKQAEHHLLSRESIIERLLRFFRSRPTVESLRERGIYKPEPVFGSTLSAICTHEKTFVPKFISVVTRLIEERGLDIDGLYRVNGNLSSVQKIRCQIDQDKYDALQTEEDVHVLTGSLKLFFRELFEPLFPISMNRDFMSAIREPNIRQRFKAIDDLLLKLPEVNRETLKVLVLHLERVANHSGKNRMQVHNLAIMFGPTLFGTEDRIAAQKNSSDSKGRNTRRKSTEKREDSQQIAEPSQNLAYKMVIYGQIVEFILNESKKFSLFTSKSTPC